METLKQLADDKSVRADAKCRIKGLAKQANTLKTYFGVRVCAEIFSPCEDFAKGLQSDSCSAFGALQGSEVLVDHLQGKRSHENLNRLVKDAEDRAKSLKLVLPVPKRKTEVPKRFKHTDATSEGDLPQLTEWKRQYVEALDLVMAEIKRRFHQPGMQVAAAREEAILCAAKGQPYDITQLKLPSFIDLQKLSRHLETVRDLKLDVSDSITAAQLATMLGELDPVTRRLFSEAELLLRLVLCQPISTADSERSFSCLRRLKTWLRSRLTQQRLTHIALLHVHKELADSIDIKILMSEFSSKTPERHSVFGTFT